MGFLRLLQSINSRENPYKVNNKPIDWNRG